MLKKTILSFMQGKTGKEWKETIKKNFNTGDYL